MALELWGLFASSFIASTLFPGGSEVLLLWLVQQHEISQWVLLSVAIVGNTLGGWVTYFLGRFVAFKYPAKIFSTNKQVKAQSWLKKYGSAALLLSWMPLIGDPLCLLAGWLRLNTLLCLVFIFIGKAVRYWLLLQLATL